MRTLSDSERKAKAGGMRSTLRYTYVPPLRVSA
jgi:hypothetical protein